MTFEFVRTASHVSAIDERDAMLSSMSCLGTIEDMYGASVSVVQGFLIPSIVAHDPNFGPDAAWVTIQLPTADEWAKLRDLCDEMIAGFENTP